MPLPGIRRNLPPQSRRGGGPPTTWHRLRRSRSAVVGSVVLILISASAIFAPLVGPYHPLKTNQRESLQAPSAAYLMGTDRFGRDVFSRVLWGGRISLLVGFISVGIGGSLGLGLGLLAGYTGGRTEAVIMRLVDLMLAFPGILLALAIIATLGGSLINLMIAVGISSVPNYVRLARGSVLRVKEEEYVLAARAVGSRDYQFILKHILPNVLAPVIVLATLNVASAIIVGSALSFLGLGMRPPTPEWGSMLADGQEFLRHAWWIAFFPGLAIMVTVFSFNLFGDGLRDALDPRMRVAGTVETALVKDLDERPERVVQS